MREIKKINGLVGGYLLVGTGEAWGPSLPPLKSDLVAERVKMSNERSGAVSGGQKIKWSVSGAEREVVWADRERKWSWAT